MKRSIDNYLLEWKENPLRKVLLLRGARQVGKTYSVRELGKTFSHFLEINFDEKPAMKDLFTQSLGVEQIIERLSIITEVPIISNQTLLFLDEIQECPQALSLLRYFQEKLPTLHVIAAGSLLEFALSEIPSMGVGRLHSLFMYPLCFTEYLVASGHEQLQIAINNQDMSTPIDPLIHQTLLEKLRIFMLIGGMPGIVNHYLLTHDILQCQTLLQDIVISYEDDFAKYKKKVPVARLREVFKAVIFQGGQKFSYSQIESDSYHKALKEALDLLILAGLVYKIPYSSCQGIPLGATTNPKHFKVLPFDLGIAQRVLGVDLSIIVLQPQPKLVNIGALSEVYAGLELINSQVGNTRPELYFWHREARGSHAEVDFVISGLNGIIPIEVKAGTKGQMQSMYLFLKEKGLSKGIRLSQENFSQYDLIQVAPLYAASRCWTIY